MLQPPPPERRKAARFGPAPFATIALAGALGACVLPFLAGCLPQSDRSVVIREAPVVATDTPTQEEAYWQNRYRNNRPTPPEQYQVFPKPPRNNQFGEFDDSAHQGLDKQPALPALPADQFMAEFGGSSGASTIAASYPVRAEKGEGPRPAAPATGTGPQSGSGIMAGNHYYPMEQLVYGGDHPDIDRPENYRLMPKDAITVTVRDHPEFSGQLEIQPDGTVRIPNAHDLVRLRGLTVDAAAEELRRVISVYVRGDCQVRVQANRARGGYYFVFGDVLQPGRFPMGMEPIKLTDAVLAANWEANPARRDADGDELGPSFPAASPRGRYIAPRTADLAAVTLVTPHRSQPVRSQYDVRSAMLGVAAQDPIIRPGQIIVVPSLDPQRNRELGLEAVLPERPSPAPFRQADGFAGSGATPRLPEVAPDPRVDVPTADSWSVSAVDANMTSTFADNLNTATNGPPRMARVRPVQTAGQEGTAPAAANASSLTNTPTAINTSATTNTPPTTWGMGKAKSNGWKKGL